MVVQELLKQCFFFFSNAFDKPGSVFVCQFGKFSRNIGNIEYRTQRIIVPDNGLIGDKVNHPGKVVFLSDGNLKGNGVGAEFLFHLVENPEEIGSRAIHFIDKSDAGNLVLISLFPDSFALGLNTSYGTEQGDSAIEYPE